MLWSLLFQVGHNEIVFVVSLCVCKQGGEPAGTSNPLLLRAESEASGRHVPEAPVRETDQWWREQPAYGRFYRYGSRPARHVTADA